MTHAVLDEILAGLMRRYSERVPDVARIVGAMLDQGVIATKTTSKTTTSPFERWEFPTWGFGR